MRRLREQTAQLAELTVHLERERERAEHAAVAEERGRIARELHDVVAHGVSVIAIQADAAEAALDRDPELARAPLRTIRGSAQARRWRRCAGCSGCCARTTTAASCAPQPGLGAARRARRARARGRACDVTLAVDGEPRPLAPGLDLSAYRIVQEALTNVRKHAAGAPARVRVDVGAATSSRSRSATTARAARRQRRRGTGSSACASASRLHGGELHAGPGRGRRLRGPRRGCR